MDKKYEVMNNCTIQHNGITLYKIRAIKNFGKVKTGALGGWIESEDNLSHEGNCWVADNAKVFGPAKITENAIISDNATVCGESNIYGNAEITNYANVTNVIVRDKARIKGNAIIAGYGENYKTSGIVIGGYITIQDFVSINGYEINIRGYGMICNSTRIYNVFNHAPITIDGEASIFGRSLIAGGTITGVARLQDVDIDNNPFIAGQIQLNNCKVSGNAYLCSNEYLVALKDLWIGEGAYITNDRSTLLFKTPRHSCTAYLCKDGSLRLMSGDSVRIFDYEYVTTYIKNKKHDFGNYAAFWNAADMILCKGNQQIPLTKENT